MVVNKTNSRVRQMFSEIAPRYDLLNHVLSLNIDRYWRKRTVDLVAPRGTEPILDLCTGTGDLAFAYAKATTGQVPIIAADFCHEMLLIAEGKKKRWGYGDAVSFVEADAQRLPLPSEYFQIVTAAFGLRNVADTDRGLSEMARVCCGGGRVAVLEFSKPHAPPLSLIYSTYFRHVLPRIGRMIARHKEAYAYLPESVADFPEGEALADRMRAAGLRDVWYRRMTFGIATLYVGTK